MSDIFNEVDEELRRDQVEGLFRRYLPHMIALALVVVAGVAGREAWNWYQVQRETKEANTYAAASQLLKDGKGKQALAAFEQIAKSGPEGYANMALLQAAGSALSSGETANAVSLYKQAAQKMDDPLFKDLATIKAVMIQYDSLKFDELEKELDEASQPGRPYRALARELIASKALSVGKLDRARSEYKSLEQSLDTSSGVLQRAQTVLALMGPEPEPAKADDAAKKPQNAATEGTEAKSVSDAKTPNKDDQQ